MAKGKTKTTVLALAFESVALLGVYTFFAGWWYMSAYMYDFGLTQSSIDFPAFYIVSQAFRVFASPYSLILFFGLVVYIVLRNLIFKELPPEEQQNQISSWAIHLSDVICLVMIFFVIYIAAVNLGRKHAKEFKLEDDISLPNITISMNQSSAIKVPSCKLKHLFSSDSAYYVFCPISKKSPAEYKLYIYNKSVVEHAEIYWENKIRWSR